MPYSYTLTSVIPATPQEIYQAWLDSVAHSEMTGSEAVMSDELGAEVSAWNGYITGRNLELVPGERIVQSWRTSEFGDEHADSIVTVMLEGTDEGTLLTLVHSNVPEEQRSYEEGGWESNYFEPMRAYFAEFGEEEVGEEEAGEEPQPAAPKPAPKRAPKKAPKQAPKQAPKRAPKPAAKVRRAAGKKAKKTKKTLARVKASPARKKKTKRAAAAKKKRKSTTFKKPAKRAAAKRESGRKKPGRR